MSLFIRRCFAAMCIVAFVLVTASCGGGGPEGAVKKSFEEWTKVASVIYRNATFETLSSSNESPTIKITAEFQNAPEDQWVEQEAIVQVIKQDSEWKAPTMFGFVPSPRAVQTLQAIQDATATVEAARYQATVSAQQAAFAATATSRAATQVAQATGIAATQVAQATEFARSGTATAQAQATAAAAATQQAAILEATAAAEATQQAIVHATVVAQRTTFVNKPLAIQTVENDSSEFRAYFKNVDFILVGVERASENSVLWNFYIWNHNDQDTFNMNPREAYIVSQDGTKYDALQWEAVSTVAGERKNFTIAFNAPTTSGVSYKLFLATYLQATNLSGYVYVQWQPFEVNLP